LVSRLKAKRELSALALTQKASEKDQEGGRKNSAAADFAKALRWYYERCEKCVVIGSGPSKKNLKVKVVIAITVFCL
jgi:hypothetical protein